ncbi:MAG: DUF2142 domain-containing protein, partial [Lachnospiraceae bacterium]|nr:DUF2142 domain-containing protein [Lachnospiraceae bacterium]
LISVKIQGDDGKEFVGRELPSALCINWNGPDAKWKDGESWKNIVIEEGNKSFIEFPNTALYSPFTYLPQVLGISIGKILTNKVIIIAYMGRVLSWLAVGLIMYLTIKYIPMGKMLLTVVTLLPMNMQECISLAADGFTYAICTAFIAFVLYMRYGYNGKMKKKHFVILYVLLFFISTVKIVYMPLCLLAFLIPVQRFGDKRSYFKHAGLAALLAITTCLVWFIISSNILVTFNPGADSDAHMQHIIKAPMEYIRILFGTVISEFDFYLKMMVGAYLGWLNINQNALIVDLSIALIIIVLVKEKYSINSNVSIKPVRVISAIAVFSIILLMFTSLYIQWTPVSSSIITGVQGRYFLPLIFPTALMIKSYCFEKEDRINGSDTNLLMSMSALCIVVINICAFISMSTFFVI